MKRLFETIKLSLTSKAFYQRILHGTEPMGFKYVYILNIIFSLILASASIPIVYSIVSPKVHQKVVQTIPTDLEIFVKNGTVSINQPEPYIVENKWKNDFKNSEPKNLVVIDTKSDFTIDQLFQYDTFVLIKKNSVITKKTNGGVEIIQNPKDLNFTFNKTWVKEKIDSLYWIGYVLPIAIFVFGITFGFAFILLSYLIWAMIAWVLLKWFIKTKEISFKKAYSVTLYSTTVFFILKTLSMLLPFLKGSIVQFVVFAAFLYYITKENVAENNGSHTIIDDDKNNGVV